jgi:hypothetical protein
MKSEGITFKPVLNKNRSAKSIVGIQLEKNAF